RRARFQNSTKSTNRDDGRENIACLKVPVEVLVPEFRRRNGRGIFYLIAIAKEKVDNGVASKKAINDCGGTESGTRAQVSDIILSIGHNSGLSAPEARRWTRILG